MAPSGTRQPRPVVGLAFGSALFADVFGRIIAEHGVVVSRLSATGEPVGAAGRSPESAAPANVAVVCGAPEEVAGDVVVCLPDEGLAPPGSTTSVVVARGDQRDTVEVADVDSLINLVVELATSR